MQPGPLVYIHFTLLAYAPGLILLQHCTYISHCNATVVYIYTQHYCSYQYKTTKCWFNLPCYFHLCTKIKPSLKCHIYAIYPNYSMCINDRSMWMYMQNINLLQWVMWPEMLYTNDGWWHPMVMPEYVDDDDDDAWSHRLKLPTLPHQSKQLVPLKRVISRGLRAQKHGCPSTLMKMQTRMPS